MNFGIFKKLMALPLNSSERSVTTSLVSHVQKDGNSCFPSYALICKESGVSNSTLSKVIKTLIRVGLLDRKHRANVMTGKESNEYFFTFEGIKFYRDKLSKAESARIEALLKKARKAITLDMKAQNRANKRQAKDYDTSTYWSEPKSQNSNIGVRVNTGLEASTIPPHIGANPPHIGAEVIRENVQPLKVSAENNTVFSSHSQSQRQPDGVKSYQQPNHPKSHYPERQKAGNQVKSPQQQTKDEWLADFEGR